LLCPLGSLGAVGAELVPPGHALPYGDEDDEAAVERYLAPSRDEFATVTFADMPRPKSKIPKARPMSNGATRANSIRPCPRARRCDGRRLHDDDTLPPESLIRSERSVAAGARDVKMVVTRTNQIDQAAVTGALRAVTSCWRHLHEPGLRVPGLEAFVVFGTCAPIDKDRE
jgi:hypothetical protein